MSKKRVQIDLDIENRDAQRKIKDINKELGNTEDALEDVESAGKQMAKAIGRAADDMIDEIDSTKRAVDAMEKALGDTDFDSRNVVADLKRVGLTAEDIEQDADELAKALKRSADVKVHATAQGFDDLEQAVGGIHDETGKTRDTMSGFIGGTVGELPGISEAMGPVSEGLGQLAEGALSGEINFKQLALAGGAMAGVAFVLDKVQSRMARIAEYKTWKTEQVESYTDALKDADTVVEAVAEKLKDAGELTISLGEGLFEIDLLPALNKAGVGVEDLSTLIAGGQEAVDDYAAAMEAAGVPLDQYGVVVAAAEQEIGFLAEGQEAAAASAAFFGESEDDASASTEAHTAAVSALSEAFEENNDLAQEKLDLAETALDAEWALVDSGIALEDAQQDLGDAIQDALDVGNDAEATDRDRADAMRAVTDAAVDVAKAEVRKAEDTATANGTALTAIQRSDTYRRSLLDQAHMLNGEARTAILNRIADINKIPAEKRTEFDAAIDNGDIATAEAILNATSRNRDTVITATANMDYANWTLSQWRQQQQGTPVSIPVYSRSLGPQLAAGTPYHPGGPAIINEHLGGELVDLPMGTSVTRAAKSDGMRQRETSGSTVVNNIIQHFPAGTRPADVINAQRRYGRIQGPT